MADPFSEVGAGDVSPFLKSFSTVSKSLDILRRIDRDGQDSGGGAYVAPPLHPSTHVLVRNDTGADLPAGSILALGDNVTPFIKSDPNDAMTDDAHRFRVTPTFKGTTPAATTDKFAILLEATPAATSASDISYFYGRGVVLGDTVCNVNITDTGHGYATPTASDNTKLTSASSGPVIIRVKESTGTGTKRCAVLLTQVTPGTSGGGVAVKELDNSPSLTSITSLVFDQSDGFIVSSGGAGIAQIDIAAATTTQAGVISISGQTMAGTKIFQDGVFVAGNCGLQAAGGALASPTVLATQIAPTATSWPNGVTTPFINAIGGYMIYTDHPDATHGYDLWVIPAYYWTGVGSKYSGRLIAGGRYAIYDSGTVSTGWSGSFAIAGGFTVTVVGGIVTNVA